jgi:transcriptional regulator GlxA family with amidase domain
VQFGIFIYDGVEPIDLAVFGVLSMARRIAPEIAICTIAPHAGDIALANGLKVTADFGIDDAPACDVVIIAGGPGWTAQAKAPQPSTISVVSTLRAASPRSAPAA